MTVPRETIERKVREWLLYAQQDHDVARHTLSMQDCPHQVVCFLAQQSAEKSLKAFLVFRGQEVPFSHNISMLLERCERLAAWPSQLVEAERLTPYAVVTRYPGSPEPLTVEEARAAVDLARLVVDTVRTALKNEGLA